LSNSRLSVERTLVADGDSAGDGLLSDPVLLWMSVSMSSLE
jgi:hypothetical protein